MNWEVDRRASSNVLVGSDRRNLKICFGTEISYSRRSTVRVWWTFLVTLVSILSHDAKKISLLSPGTGNKSINYSHQPSVWKTLLFSCSSYNFDALFPPESYHSRGNIVIFQSSWVSVQIMPSLWSCPNSHSAPVDAWILSTVIGSMREEEHTHSLVILSSRSLLELSRRGGGLIS